MPNVHAVTFELALEWGADESDNCYYALNEEHPSLGASRSGGGVVATTSDGFTLGYVEFRLKRVGNPTANLTAGVWATSGGVATGNCLVWSESKPCSEVNNIYPDWFGFSFAYAEYDLSGSTVYGFAVTVNCSEVDGSNYIIYYGTTNTTASYSRMAYSGGSWSLVSSAYDDAFRIWAISPSCWVTARYGVGGEFRIDNATMVNGSSLEFESGSSFECAALPEDSSWVFSSFSWSGGFNLTNPYNFTISANTTVWCNFVAAEEDNFLLGGLLVGVVGFLCVVVVLRKRS